MTLRDCVVNIPFVQRSLDGRTRKYLFRTDDDFGVEVAFIRLESKDIVCFSCQVGCPIGCLFCVSGRRGVNRAVRSLSEAEIRSQVQFVLDDNSIGDDRVVLFSAMGEGEPLLAYDAVVGTLKAFESLPNAKVALSTSGVSPDRIRWLASEAWASPLKLQFSLHSHDDSVRQTLIPATAPLEKILPALEYFVASTGYPVEMNYVLLDFINDSSWHAEGLASLALAGNWFIKLNRFNASSLVPYRRSSEERALDFVRVLDDAGVRYESYETNGADIGAACGQLSYKSAKVTEIRHL